MQKQHIYLSLLIILLILVGGFFLFGGRERIINNSFDLYGTSTNNGGRDLKVEQEGQTNNLVENNKEKQMIATIKTNFGEIKLELFSKDAPNTVANFSKLAGSGFYNSTKFHRVIKGFMIQGGDPLTKDETQSGNWGRGGPGYTFADEIHSGNLNAIGTISMANAGPDTNSSQFFINTANNSFLNEKHTVFGKVIAGMDVVSLIENNPTANQDRPIKPVILESVIVSEK